MGLAGSNSRPLRALALMGQIAILLQACPRSWLARGGSIGRSIVIGRIAPSWPARTARLVSCVSSALTALRRN